MDKFTWVRIKRKSIEINCCHNYTCTYSFICLKLIAFHSYYIYLPPESASTKHPHCVSLTPEIVYQESGRTMTDRTHEVGIL